MAVIGVHDLYPKEASANALVDSFIKTWVTLFVNINSCEAHVPLFGGQIFEK